MNQCAIGIFFLIELLLLRFREISTVGFDIRMFLLFDRIVIGFQLAGLLLGQVAILDILIDTLSLILDSLIHFVASRVLFGKLATRGIPRIIRSDPRHWGHQADSHRGQNYSLHG